MNATAIERITEIPGAAIDPNAYRFASDAGPGSIDLATRLGVLAGSVREGSGGTGYQRSEAPPAGWRRLRDLPPELVQRSLDEVVLAEGRAGRAFRLDAPVDLPILDQVDVHFARAVRRKAREG